MTLKEGRDAVKRMSKRFGSFGSSDGHQPSMKLSRSTSLQEVATDDTVNCEQDDCRADTAAAQLNDAAVPGRLDPEIWQEFHAKLAEPSFDRKESAAGWTSELPEADETDFPSEIVRTRPRNSEPAPSNAEQNAELTSSSLLAAVKKGGRSSPTETLDAVPSSASTSVYNASVHGVESEGESEDLSEDKRANESDAYSANGSVTSKRSRRWSRASESLSRSLRVRRDRSEGGLSRSRTSSRTPNQHVNGTAQDDEPDPGYRRRQSIGDLVRSKATADPKREKKHSIFGRKH